jgi:plastocyanin
MMFRAPAVLLLVLAFLSACGGGDGGDGGPGPVLTLEKWTPSGDLQVDTAGQLLPKVLRVKVTQDGTPVPGVVVNFGGTGSFGKPVDTTDALGIATSSWTLSISAGGQSATATVAGAVGSPLTYTATAVPDAPVSLILVSGDDQTAQLGTLYMQPLVVKVADQYGNGINGFMTHWSNTGPAVRTNDSLPTNLQGHASQVMTAGDTVGAVLVTATATGLTGSPREFSSTVVPQVALVTVNSNFYSPTNQVISAGSSVRWEWISGTHSVTPDSAGFFVGSDVETVGFLHGPLTFANPGVYTYHCQVHPGMTGTITVN